MRAKLMIMITSQTISSLLSLMVLVNGKSWPEVQKIAIKLFSMATSSASSERNFAPWDLFTQSSRTA